MQLRKRRTRRPRRRRPSRFNGAATLQLRKPSSVGQLAGFGGVLQWGRNFAVAETHSRGVRRRMPSSLQWGRNFAVAETAPPRQVAPPRQAASMGPQLCSCGNLPPERATDRRSPALQWGRNFAVAETLSFLLFLALFLPLQWGRNFAVAETSEMVKALSGLMMLQWGRNFAVAETRQGCVHWRNWRQCFNGAATLQLRKRACAAWFWLLLARLQWGRNFAVAETEGVD